MSQYIMILMLSVSVPFLYRFFPPLKFYRNINCYRKLLMMEYASLGCAFILDKEGNICCPGQGLA